jgi:hypothetical protein
VTNQTTPKGSLDQVLVRCLRIFANHGRKVRMQQKSICSISLIEKSIIDSREVSYKHGDHTVVISHSPVDD